MIRHAILALGVLASGAGMAAEPRSPAEFDAAYARLETAPGATNDPARLKALFDLTWRYQMVESPETATAVGYPGLNDQWSDLSPAAMARRRQEVRRSLRVLATLDSGTLTPDERLYRDLFERALREQADGDRFPEELL
ncbi:MAG: hypothetical protein RIS76_210, partial [Verrucomicrobiota bacterium]